MLVGIGVGPLESGESRRATDLPAVEYVNRCTRPALPFHAPHHHGMPEAGCRMRVDGDLGDFSSCQFISTLNLKAAAPGFEGKMAIHPSQIEIIHQVLTPTKGQIAWANEVIEAMAAPFRDSRKNCWLGEGLGAQNEEIFQDLLGLKTDEIRRMRDEGVI
jgi:hypothetical protein